MQDLRIVIKEAAEDVDERAFRNTYSGRGMYSRQCIAITGTRSEVKDILASAIKSMTNEVVDVGLDGDENELLTASEEFSKNLDTLLDYEEDSMGLGIVVYWRRLAPLPDEEDVSEESTSPSSAP